MSMAWEVTTEDITQVLEAHKLALTDEISEQVSEDDVEAAVLSYVDFDNQVTAALCEIEDQLITAGVIKGEKKFNPPEGDDEWTEDEDDE